MFMDVYELAVLLQCVLTHDIPVNVPPVICKVYLDVIYYVLRLTDIL
jgi:hypothetical protein